MARMHLTSTVAPSKLNYDSFRFPHSSLCAPSGRSAPVDDDSVRTFRGAGNKIIRRLRLLILRKFMTYAKARCAKLHFVIPLLVMLASPCAKPIEAQTASESNTTQQKVSVTSHTHPADMRGSARLLIHDMPSTQGGVTRASTLLFVPEGAAPAALHPAGGGPASSRPQFPLPCKRGHWARLPLG